MMDIYNNLYEEYIRRAVGLLHKYNLKDKEEKTQYKNELAEFIVKNVNNRISNIFDRNRKYLTTLKENLINAGKSVYEIKFVSTSRVLIDTSSPLGWLIDEVGIIWDPLLETPYIPSTQIMGALRAAITIDSDYKLIEAIWGNPKDVSKNKLALLHFSSAYPIQIADVSEITDITESRKSGLLEREVITPMYGDSPKETETMPKPVQFIVISRNIVFEALLVIDTPRLFTEEVLKYVAEKVDVNENITVIIDRLKKKIMSYLRVAVEDIGFGSKTSSNYGLFKLL